MAKLDVIPLEPDVLPFADYNKVVVTNGYGTRMEAGVEIGPNLEVEVKAKMEFEALKRDSYDKTSKFVVTKLKEHEQLYLNKNYTGYAAGAGFFSGFFGFLVGGGYNYNENKRREYEMNKYDESGDIKKSLLETVSGKVQIEMSMKVTNPNPFPVEVKIFVMITKVQINDKVTLVVSTDARAADKDHNELPTRDKRLAVNDEL